MFIIKQFSPYTCILRNMLHLCTYMTYVLQAERNQHLQKMTKISTILCKSLLLLDIIVNASIFLSFATMTKIGGLYFQTLMPKH